MNGLTPKEFDEEIKRRTLESVARRGLTLDEVNGAELDAMLIEEARRMTIESIARSMLETRDKDTVERGKQMIALVRQSTPEQMAEYQRFLASRFCQ